MRRIARWLGIGVGGLLAVAAILYGVRRDPFAMVSGRAVTGDLVTEAVEDWSFTDDHFTIAVETRPAAPHSVTTIAFTHEGDLYVPARDGAAKSWPHYVVSDPRVRLKIGDSVYPAIAEHVTDPAIVEGLFASAQRKYQRAASSGDGGIDRGSVWVFRMTSPPVDVAAGPPSSPPAAVDPAVRLATALELVAAGDRSEDDRAKDAGRKPAELLAFAGVSPGMSVADLGAGAGYTTELLARAVGPTGVVYAQNTPAVIEKYVKESWPARLAKPVNARVKRIDSEIGDPLPGVSGLDVITVVYWYHDWLYAEVDRAAVNARLFEALVPGGSLVIVDHRALPGSGEEAGNTVHRIDEALLRGELLAAGFLLAAEGDFMANPEDPRTEAFFRMEGPTDTFVHRYVKPAGEDS